MGLLNASRGVAYRNGGAGGMSRGAIVAQASGNNTGCVVVEVSMRGGGVEWADSVI